MLIQGYNVPVNVCRELQEFDWGTRCRWYPEKLHACSPFRQEDTPSFVVFFDHGNWVDRGFARAGYEKGNFVTLLAYLRGEDKPTTERHLLRKYLAVDVDGVSLDLRLILHPPVDEPLDAAVLDHVQPSEYLLGRGISHEVQRQFGAGHHPFLNAAVLPWWDRDGGLANVKYRAVDAKRFWFAKKHMRMDQHLFGALQCRGVEDDLYVVEGEIDALYLHSNGLAAVALGTAHMSEKQEKMLIQHPAKRIIIATDADAAGRKCAADIARRLGGYKEIGHFLHPEGCKDINDIRPFHLALGA